MGDLIDVKLLEVSSEGKLRLSRRAVLLADGATPPPGLAEQRPQPRANGRRPSTGIGDRKDGLPSSPPRRPAKADSR